MRKYNTVAKLTKLWDKGGIIDTYCLVFGYNGFKIIWCDEDGLPMTLDGTEVDKDKWEVLRMFSTEDDARRYMKYHMQDITF